ncbi:hypothetical protein DMB66_41600 [Actinoplanes sp. ATCC 53533]|nr:hypothetical protein DMB66_41600 [Actinoplanes sp. ATCC 53533]
MTLAGAATGSWLSLPGVGDAAGRAVGGPGSNAVGQLIGGGCIQVRLQDATAQRRRRPRRPLVRSAPPQTVGHRSGGGGQHRADRCVGGRGP